MKLIDCLKEVGVPLADIRESKETEERLYRTVGEAVARALETNPVVFEFEILPTLKQFIRDNGGEMGWKAHIQYDSASSYKENPHLRDLGRFSNTKLDGVLKELVKKEFGVTDYSLRGRGSGLSGGQLKHSRIFYHDEQRMKNHVASRISIVKSIPIVELRAEN
jgi:hypothetical protein